MVKVNDIEVELLPGMEVQHAEGGIAGDYDLIMYHGIEIDTADPEYKLELRPGPFFVDGYGTGHLEEFTTLQAAKDYIDNGCTWDFPVETFAKKYWVEPMASVLTSDNVKAPHTPFVVFYDDGTKKWYWVTASGCAAKWEALTAPTGPFDDAGAAFEDAHRQPNG